MPQPIDTFIRKQGLNLFVKLPLLLVAGWALYRQVVASGELERLWVGLAERWQWPRSGWLALAAGLVLPNIGLEVWRFRLLSRRFTEVGLGKALRAVLGGMAVGIGTPNRVGEYLGRIFFFEKSHALQVATATMAGSLAQWVVLSCAGMAGSLIFFEAWIEEQVGIGAAFLVAPAGGLALVLCLLLYNLDLLLRLSQRLPLGRWYQAQLRKLAFLKHYDAGEISWLLVLSLLRYATYCSQFVLLLWFWGLELGYLQALAGVAFIFFVQMFVPLPPLAGLVARGELAVLVFGVHAVGAATVVAATFSLFVINVALPAVAGLVLVMLTNIGRTFGGRNSIFNGKHSANK